MPIAVITARTNTTVTHQGNGVYRVTKINSSSLDGDAVSNVGYSGDFTLKLTPIGTSTATFLGGINTDPNTDASWTSLDYGIYLASDTTVYGYENSNFAWQTTVDPGTTWWIGRRNGLITIGYGNSFDTATIVRTNTDSQTFYFDTSMGTIGSVVDVQFYDVLTQVLTTSATLNSSGTIAANTAMLNTVFVTKTNTLDAPLAGRPLASSVVNTDTLQASLTGIANISANAIIVVPLLASATLNGAGTITANISVIGIKQANTAATSTGSLTANATAIRVVQTSRTSTGTITANAVRVLNVSATFQQATGTLAADNELFLKPTQELGSFPLASAPLATSSKTLALSASVVLTGTATTNFSARLIQGASTNLTASGSLTAPARVVHRISQTLSGTGTATANVSIVAPVAANLSGTSTFASNLSVVRLVSAQLSSTGQLAASAEKFFGAVANLSATSTLSSSVTLTNAARATLNGTGSLTGSARLVNSVSANLVSYGTASGVLVRITRITANLTGTGSIVANANSFGPVSAQLIAYSTLYANATRVRPDAVTIASGILRLPSMTRVNMIGVI